MQNNDVRSVSDGVAAANAVLARLAAPNAADTTATAVHDLHAILEGLQPRMLALSSSAVATAANAATLMDAGIALYNGSRSALRAIDAQHPTSAAQTNNTGDKPAASTTTNAQHSPSPTVDSSAAARFEIIAARFCACKIMRASLHQSKSCAALAPQTSERTDPSRFVNDCVDVLRSFGRVGALLLEQAKLGMDRCQQYLRAADDAFACCHQIWTQIGLSCLTKLKHDLELEEILADLWDFNAHRVRVLHLLVGNDSSNDDDDAMDDCSTNSNVERTVEAIRELHMLLPYVPGYRNVLLQLLNDSSDIYKAAGRHHELALLTEEALRVCESIATTSSNTNHNSGHDSSDDETLLRSKQQLLVNVLGSFGAMKDYQRADTCFGLLPQQRDPDALFLMVQIYVDAQQYDKARTYLQTLFELDCLTTSIRAARLFAQAQSFSDDALAIYQDLERNYGDNNVAISLDLACNLAFSDAPARRALAMAELKRLATELKGTQQSDSSQATHTERIHRTVFDASQHALNQNVYQECIEWAQVGASIALCERETSLYMRMLSLCNLRLGQQDSARQWAEQAVAIEPTKKSLFALFNVELEALESSNDVASTTDAIKAIATRLKARDDFEIADLIALAKVAHDAGAAKQRAVLAMLDDICLLVVDNAASAGELPIGVLLQHTAQLAHKCCTETNTNASAVGESGTVKSVTALLQTYAHLLLRAVKTASHAALGPASVFEWFYAMSFHAAKTAESAELFVLAAELARASSAVYGDSSPLQQREAQCLLAAIACSMKHIESLDTLQLNAFLETVERCEACFEEHEHPTEIEYLARCVFTIKVRQFDPNTDGIFKLCRAKLPRHVDEFVHLAEFVLFATTFDDASEVRQRYRHLASDLFKFGLQVALQSDAVAADTLCYLFRRLIALADSKASALEWLEQFVQLAGSLAITMPEDDVEWMVAKAWNIGILHHRNHEYAEARQFMDVAMQLLEISSALAQRLRSDLQAQYQYFLSSLAPSHAAKSTHITSRQR